MYEGTPYEAGLVVATVLSLVLAVLTWRNRRAPGAVPFLLLVIGLAIWTATVFLAAVDPVAERSLIWFRLTYLGIPLVVLGWFLFALAFTGRDEWVTPTTAGVLSVEPIAVQVLVWTNDYHHLFWREMTADPYEAAQHGLAFWIHTLYSYSLLAAGAALLVAFVIRSQTLYRDQVLVLLIAITGPWVANAAYLFTGFDADLTPLLITVAAGGIAWAMYRYAFMDLVPVARETIVDELNDGVAVLDRHDRIVDLNSPIGPLLRTDDVEEAVGERIEDVVDRTAIIWHGSSAHGRVVGLEPEDEAVGDTFESLLEGDPLVERTAELELDREGERRVYELALSPFFAKKSKLTGRLLVLTDVTGRKRRERRLRELARELDRRTREQAALIENIPGIVYRIDDRVDGPLSFVSSAVQTVTGFPPEEFETGGRSLHGLIHGDERGRVAERKRTAVRERDRYDLTYRIRDASGGQRWVRDVGEGIYDGEDLVCVEGVVLDVTESKEHEGLQVLNRVLRHNVRNEMNVVKGYADLAADRAKAEVEEWLDIVEDKADEVIRMSEKARTVQGLLVTQTTTTQPIDVFDALHEAFVRIDARYRDVAGGRFDLAATGELESTGESPNPFESSVIVYGNDHLSTALYELLENAIVHGANDERIEVTVHVEKEAVTIRISDSGPGIPSTERQVIEEGVESPLHHGSGMGLWICQWVLEPHGQLEFESDSTGTTAIVRLRRIDENEAVELEGSVSNRIDVSVLEKSLEDSYGDENSTDEKSLDADASGPPAHD